MQPVWACSRDAVVMPQEIISRWPVRLPLELIDADCDGGRLTMTGAARLFAAARAAYFEESTTVDPRALALRGCTLYQGNAQVVGDRVSVSVNVSELFDDAFTMTTRIRPARGEGIAASGACSLAPTGGVTYAMREEFIEREHAARFTH